MKSLVGAYEYIYRAPRVVKYVISGGSGATVNLGTLFVLTHYVGIWYLLSSIIAFLISFFVGFTLQRTWTFNHRTSDGLVRHTSLYFAVVFGNTILNTVFVYSLVEFVHIWYIAAQFMSGILIACGSYFLYRKIFI